MMKWKARTETTNIGILELGNLTFDEDYMQVSIDICDMSDSLKEDVAKAVEIAKIKHIERNKALNKEKGFNLPITWSNEPVVIDYTYLRIVLEAGQPISYYIETGFHDAVTNEECWDCSIAVDLSDYANELKKAVINVLIDKFF